VFGGVSESVSESGSVFGGVSESVSESESVMGGNRKCGFRLILAGRMAQNMTLRPRIVHLCECVNP